MSFLIWGIPWYVWLIFVVGVAYIGFISWFCQYGTYHSFNKKTSKYCFWIIISTFLLIIIDIITIYLFI